MLNLNTFVGGVVSTVVVELVVLFAVAIVQYSKRKK